MSNIYSRVHYRKDTIDAWSRLNPTPLDGEIILVDTGESVRFKVGDGKTDYNSLPFLDDEIKEVLSSKVSATFTSADSGKVLGIDSEGKVVPVDALKGSKITWGDLTGENSTTEYTSNLNLKKPGSTDLISLKDFNDNFDRIDTLDDRVSNLLNELTENPDYASTAEVVDIRSGYDGVLYETAGDAVRSLGYEISRIKDDLQIIDPDDLGLEQDEETGIVYPTFQGVRSINGIPLAATGGGGGAVSTTVFKLRSTTESNSFTVALGSSVKVSYTFSSVDSDDGTPTGNGTASYYVNDSLILNTTIPQGVTEFDCSAYIKSGVNEVRVTVTDTDGNRKSLSWDITCIEVKLTSTFDYTLSYPGDVTYKYTAYGDAEKTIHFIVDGVETNTATIMSSGKQSTIVFSGLSHGIHTLEVYATATVNGSDIESPHLLYDIIVIKEGSVTPVISINNVKTSLLQGELAEVPYIVYDPLSSESTVTLSIYKVEGNENVLYKTETRTVDRSLQSWSTRDYPTGLIRFTVSLREISRSTLVEVTENKLPIEPTTNDLELHLTSANRSNSETSPDVWSYNGIETTFTNVNWASSGWLADNTGDTALHLGGGSTATINFKPFSTDLRVYGKTLEFDFAVRDVNNRDANVISCKSGNIGIEITADRATLSSNLSSVECRFHDERRLRVAFVIESRSEYRLMSVYLNGVLTSAHQYVSTDNFQQSVPVNISIGSPYCSVDLYTVRSYSTALTQEELINNYICDISDLNTRTEVYDDNNLYDDARNLLYEKVKSKIPVMTITGPLPASKGDKKDVTVSYEDFRDSSMNFKDLPCNIDVQGTSSQWYVRKNYKLKFKTYFSHIKGGIPVKVFCVKADYAEATSTHNTQNANLIHTLYSDKTPAQESNESCRTTVQGFPIVIYHKETSDSTPVFLGKYNFNHDKGSEEVFGFTGDYDVESWEFCNNTSDACNFTGNIPESFSLKDENNNEVGWVNDFERRYPDHGLIEDGDEDPEVAISRFKLMHDWVVSTGNYDLSDPEVLATYRTEFEERFNLHKTLIYYVWTFFMLMVDQRAKNMFLTYWADTGKWEPWFYDNDTCLGINNEGQLIFDYYHEDTDLLEDGTKVYNGQDSVLWNKFRVAYAPEIQSTYQSLRNSGKLTYDVLKNHFVVNGSDMWSESIYNEDSDYKYISMLRSEGDATNVPQVRGTGEHHLEYFAEGRLDFCDSKWYASDYANDYIVLRVNTPTTYENIAPNANLTITPFSTMYAGVRYRANGTLQQAKVSKNTPYTFIAPAENFNDTETAIYGASQISSIGNLAPLYCNYCDVSKATKLTELSLGTEDSTYESRLETLSLGTNRLLKKLDIRNCNSLHNPVNLEGCPSIEEVYAEGSSITSLELADSGYLRIVHLPNTITTLTMKHQNYIEEFSMPSYENITELNIEDTANIPIADILRSTPSLERVRLVNAEWSCSQQELSELYTKLLNCGGIDETGANIDKAVVSGIVRVSAISEDLLKNLNTDFPELMVSVNGIILCTVSYYNYDGTLLYVTTVEKGSSAPDIVEVGTIDIPNRPATEEYSYEYIGWSDSLENIQRSKSFVATYEASYAVRFYVDDEIIHIKYAKLGDSVIDPVESGEISTPVKESTEKYEYSFNSWDGSLDNIREVTNVYAVFSESIRSYDISFYNDDILLRTVRLEYGSSVEYTWDSPIKPYVDYPEDYDFLGWSPEITLVTSDISYYAMYSDSDHILDDWQTVVSRVSDNTYRDKYPLGILQRATLNYTDGTSEEIDVELVGYDHDTASDGSGRAALTFICKGILKDTHIMNNEEELNRGSWANSDMRDHLIKTVLPALPEDLRSLIIPVTKKTSAGGGSNSVEEIIDTSDSIWVPSLIELIGDYSNTDIYAAEGSTYEYFDNGTPEENKAKRVKSDKDGTAKRYWTRSPVPYSGNEYWMISTLGGGISTYASYAMQGVVFGFCIGITPTE